VNPNRVSNLPTHKSETPRKEEKMRGFGFNIYVRQLKGLTFIREKSNLKYNDF
jgi:hypothetical protein